MAYELPIATPELLGGIKIGRGLDISSEGILNIKDYDKLQQTIETSLKNVSDGKTLIASAITTKGVNTNSDDTFKTMADNILNIKSGGGYVLRTFFTMQIQKCVKKEG